MLNKVYDVMGLGHAPVDIISKVEENFLTDYGFDKGLCTVIDIETDKRLANILGDNKVVEPGGASANALAGVAALGGKCIFNSRLSNDKEGRLFKRSLDDLDIAFTGKIEEDGLSDKVFTFITSDFERTFATFYGVSHGFSTDCVDRVAIERSKILYIEGFMFNTKDGYDALLKAVDIAKECGTKIAFCPNDQKLIRNNRERTRTLVNAADILLMNDIEAMEIAGRTSIKEAVKYVYQNAECGAVTLGAEGAFFFNSSSEPFILPPPPVNNDIINTNGAGDQFAAGFLYSLSHELSFDKACKLALECGTNSIFHQAARPPKEKMANLLQKVA